MLLRWTPTSAGNGRGNGPSDRCTTLGRLPPLPRLDGCSGVTDRKYAITENELEDLLLPWKIDIAIPQRIDNPDLLEHIARVWKRLYLQKTL